MRNQQYGEGIDFPIIKQRGGRKRKGNTQRTVNFTTKSGKRVSFKATSTKRRQRRRRKTQRGGGMMPEFLSKEIGEIAGSV